MRNFLNLMSSISAYSPSKPLADRAFPFACTRGRAIGSFLLFLTFAGASALHPDAVGAQTGRSVASQIQAQTPANAPAQLTKLLTEIDAAANRRDIKAVMAFYGQNFTHSDGLNSQSLEKALKQLWERYPSLNYRTELKSWKSEGSAIVAETITTISGSHKQEGRQLNLKATIRSQQRFEGEKIVSQEILAEQTQLSSGNNPPTIQVNLPEQVQVGQEYHFDAIVREPIGDDILIGTVLEEPVSEKTLFNPSEVELELLPSGGIFKVGKAPAAPNNRWISAVLMRQGGITTITQRLRIVK
ncbi:MAG: nuclear transport factor 2 family protein [Oscillatoriales cyanobacterium RU_3_3]|nr:nuclear transport factor 2 family protein [Oscillatoriales cyanobacterium RU_3_3]